MQRPKGWTENAQAIRRKWQATVAETTRIGNGPPSYAQAIGAVNAACGKRDRIVASAGGLPAEVTANWRTLDIGTVDVEFGFSCMGYEIAGGWGARIAQAETEPDAETIVFCGDGSYLLMNSDIYSSVLTDKKLIVLVLDNGGFAVIEKLQRNTGNVSFQQPADRHAHHRAAAQGRFRRPCPRDGGERRNAGRSRRSGRGLRPRQGFGQDLCHLDEGRPRRLDRRGPRLVGDRHPPHLDPRKGAFGPQGDRKRPLQTEKRCMMKVFTATTADPDTIVDELLNGKGAVLIRGLFMPEQIADARDIIMRESAVADKVTHFQGKAAAEGKLNLQRRVWNLLAKGAVFSDMAQEPTIMAILRRFLGTEFIMGSIAANRILPGGPGQEPHVDYPYWDFHKPETHPVGLNGLFPMNAQVSVILDPFTEESGATAYVPGSQRELRYPVEARQVLRSRRADAG